MCLPAEIFSNSRKNVDFKRKSEEKRKSSPPVPTGTFFFQVVDYVSPFKKLCLPHKATDPLLSLSFRLWIFERRMIKLEMFQQSCDLNCRDSRILECNTRVLSSRPK